MKYFCMKEPEEEGSVTESFTDPETSLEYWMECKEDDGSEGGIKLALIAGYLALGSAILQYWKDELKNIS